VIAVMSRSLWTFYMASGLEKCFRVRKSASMVTEPGDLVEEFSFCERLKLIQKRAEAASCRMVNTVWAGVESDLLGESREVLSLNHHGRNERWFHS
jgi:hypothetical protein